MSSGKIEQNYFKNIENDSIFNEFNIFTDNFIQKSHFSESKSCEENVCKDFDFQTKQHLNGDMDDHLNIIQKIDFILKNSHDLTQKQKEEYCINQRFYMKLYLKRISNKI
ncbi:MAG: hypothetical protein JSV62_14540 [Promethearchaeota archaeon]|nr:MAG: hypothetical protein JSV62_14540 [Candidatus Lokiarchaeota archaeon]